jgi:hypothetical protein
VTPGADSGDTDGAATLGLGAERSVLVGLVADTHGHVDPQIVDAVGRCALCVHAGDVGGAALLSTLTQAAGRVIAVRGNNDVAAKWPLAETDLIGALPVVAHVHLPGGVLSVVHGDRHLPVCDRHERLRRAFPRARAILYGHSHRLVVDDAGTPWVINPGAAGRSRTYGGPSCIILNATAGGWTLEVLRFPASGQLSPQRRPAPP